MKTYKKRAGILKLVFIAAGAVAAIAAIGAIVAMWKKKAEEEKQREAEIEDEIRAILEEKLSDIESEDEDAEAVEEAE